MLNGLVSDWLCAPPVLLGVESFPLGFDGVFTTTALSLLLEDDVPAPALAAVPSSLSFDGVLLAANAAAHVDDGALLRPSLATSTAISMHYASALMFSPAHSITRNLFKAEEQRWIVTRPVVEDD